MKKLQRPLKCPLCDSELVANFKDMSSIDGYCFPTYLMHCTNFKCLWHREGEVSGMFLEDTQSENMRRVLAKWRRRQYEKATTCVSVS